MKKKILIVCLAIVCLMASLTFVACDKKQSDNIIKAEYVESLYGDYIRIWYDESWFPARVHIDVYHNDNYLNDIYSSKYSYLYVQTLYEGSFVPNTYMYILLSDMKRCIPEFDNYEYLTFKVGRGYSHDDGYGKILAEYTIKIKRD